MSQLSVPIELEGGVASRAWAKISLTVGGVMGAATVERGDMLGEGAWQPEGGEWELRRWLTPPLSKWLEQLSPELRSEAQRAIFAVVASYLDNVVKEASGVSRFWKKLEL